MEQNRETKIAIKPLNLYISQNSFGQNLISLNNPSTKQLRQCKQNGSILQFTKQFIQELKIHHKINLIAHIQLLCRKRCSDPQVTKECG